MTDSPLTTRQKVARGLKRRQRAEMRFRAFGIMALGFGLLCLLTLFGTILMNGAPAFQQTVIQMELTLDGEYLGLGRHSSGEAYLKADYDGLIKRQLKQQFQPQEREQRRQLYQLVSSGRTGSYRNI